ncbi:hypothetical protein QCN29_27475 [Streptomyces sp. HNM0663]|uniref:Uncharacterized protein n=1 Tax=Streptomyces chengmaiensis TaxID=3040919 RepID=A0ABT6HUQ2_9ACTN|nr:hypothetical protein [Streptomyces chengmaiensis]MDH2392451.1 hypothetical protein [Streptomyces chengmaiensis]
MDQHQPPDSARPEAARPDSEPVICSRCGKRAAAAPLTWTCSVENGVRRYFCDDCARANIRSIEGRLDSAWW